ncbi:unnamed protein product [Cylindrotheca closterium]|uniref:Fe2OG dioxygenase domain-containing protein n=1 Tax=Cylindrotheca closterium TaxID=2856 RepID=A0AAD2FHC6_9STRA|nr:unnamed protein product [Cylindrotheca closterium]
MERVLLLYILVVTLTANCHSQVVEWSNDERLQLWSRGEFNLDLSENNEYFDLLPFRRLGPVSRVRNSILRHQQSPNCDSNGFCLDQIRGGSQSVENNKEIESKIEELGGRFGADFLVAVERNKRDHEEDCKKSCELYYCVTANTPLVPVEDILGPTTIKSYSMGPVPPEDFADSFGYPLDNIKVTETKPLFSAAEATSVIEKAENEGVDKNEFKSGKYQLAGDWLQNLPETRAWFNQQLETIFFPLLAHLFPEIISSPSVIRAHSVSLLKYNASHPRTDVHIDNGILAMTLAMTPSAQYTGGGTYFEHMGVENILPMDVGHATLRPGSVRHGGHRVKEGDRYVLGAFLLLEDRVEHVRRLKNRGSELRRVPDLDGASKHFEWALALNPMCTTCLKDWAEILHTQKKFAEAEEKIRAALHLLEYKDSDALFTLGVLLSEQGRDDESIQAYQQSVEINAEDAELCYNLGVKLGAKGLVKEEMQMYAKATKANPKFGGAWLNWGTVLAESGNIDDAELMFLKALQCEQEVASKAMMNLGLIYITQGNALAQGGNLEGAMKAALSAAKYIDQGKAMLDQVASYNKADSMILKFIGQYRPLRLKAYQLLGQLHAGQGNMAKCEAEFRAATKSFPEDIMAWKLLQRILQVQGKTEELKSSFMTVPSQQRAPTRLAIMSQEKTEHILKHANDCVHGVCAFDEVSELVAMLRGHQKELSVWVEAVKKITKALEKVKEEDGQTKFEKPFELSSAFSS